MIMKNDYNPCMKIYLATGNNHKKKEMAEICVGHEIVIPSDEGITFDPIENGSSFFENSFIKAKDLWEKVKQPVLADDSGICVDILGGMPGIYSARFGREDNPNISSTEQNALLIQTVNGLTNNNEKRNCHYVCSMVLYLGPDRFYVIQETLEGVLVPTMNDSCGTEGFGYDPIVYLPNLAKTVAELTAAEKNAISHRGKAAKALLKLL